MITARQIQKQTGMSSRYILERRKDGNFTFTFRTHCEMVLLTSQAYNDKSTALRAINAARQLANKEKNYEPLRTDIGLVYYVLKNARGEVIGESQKYTDAESSRQAIVLAKATARGARLEDLTNNN